MYRPYRSLAALAASIVLAVASLVNTNQKRLTAHKNLTGDKQADTSTQGIIYGNLAIGTSAFKTILRVFLAKIGTWAQDPVVARETSALNQAARVEVQKPAKKYGIMKMLASAWRDVQQAATEQALALLKAVGSRAESYKLTGSSGLAVGAA